MNGAALPPCRGHDCNGSKPHERTRDVDLREHVMSTEMAKDMISRLEQLAEEFESSAAGLKALRTAEGLIDAETIAFTGHLNRTASQLRGLAREAELATPSWSQPRSGSDLCIRLQL